MPALVVASAILVAGCGPTGADAPAGAGRSVALAARWWPGTPVLHLLLPALALPEGPPSSADRCAEATQDDGASAPGWLRSGVTSAICPPEAAGVLAAPPAEARAQDLLTLAATCGDLRAMAAALQGGASIDGVDSCGSTALVAAAAAVAPAATARLLEAGADPDRSSSQGAWSRRPLLAALGSGDQRSAMALLRAGADADGLTPGRRSTLMLAAVRGDPGLVAELLQRGASPCRRAPDGLTALAAAKARGNTDTIELLRGASRRCAQPDESPDKPARRGRSRRHAHRSHAQ